MDAVCRGSATVWSRSLLLVRWLAESSSQMKRALSFRETTGEDDVRVYTKQSQMGLATWAASAGSSRAFLTAFIESAVLLWPKSL